MAFNSPTSFGSRNYPGESSTATPGFKLALSAEVAVQETSGNRNAGNVQKLIGNEKSLTTSTVSQQYKL